ncbi:MAG: hypothetical protein ACPHRO_12205, partial [Nannocystaceae bacterium]
CYDAPRDEDGTPIPLEQFPPAEHSLDKAASCISLLDEEDGNNALVVGGPRALGQLGYLSKVRLDTLQWTPLRLRVRECVEQETTPEPKAPSFLPTRTKVEGPTLSTLRVDDVLNPAADALLTTSRGGLRDRAYSPLGAQAPMSADVLVLPAMFRLKEGTARPGLVVWPGTARRELPAPRLQFLTWGKDPSVGWVELSTPEIRAQQWSRTDIFPLQVAIRRVPKEVPGQRAKIPRQWEDEALFEALARECRKAMKVLW